MIFANRYITGNNINMNKKMIVFVFFDYYFYITLFPSKFLFL